MKKSISKFLFLLMMGFSILSFNFTAYADDDIVVSNNSHYFAFNYYSGGTHSIDSWQWLYSQNDKVWSVSTPDQHQVYCNAWIYSNISGKWYFVDISGKMLTDCLIESNGGKYYVKGDGSLFVNGYVTTVIGSFGDKQKFYADSSGKLTNVY